LPSRAPQLPDVFFIYPFPAYSGETLFPDEYIGIRKEELNKLHQSPLLYKQEKLVVLQPVTFKNKTGFNTHRLLRAIDNNTLLSMLPPEQQAEPDEVMLPVSNLIKAYAKFPKIIHTTVNLLDACSIQMDGNPKNKKAFTGSLDGDKQLLRKLAMDGLVFRYGANNKKALERMEKELAVISKLDFNACFLISWDILRYAISRNYWYVGRGSGANSIVAYCLRITEVDPLDLDLYFERFLNPHRASPPDFDIDFSWQDRDDVIDYIFKRHGKEHTALLATYNTFKGKSIIRELGKVFGLPKPEIDQLVVIRNSEELQKKDHIAKLIYTYAKQLQGIPNYLSIHAGGVLISEQPLHHFITTGMPPKGFPLVDFDMFVAEDYGFYKYDILSQRGLGSIKDSIAVVRRNTGKTIELNTEVALQDEKVRQHIQTGNTIGCFYVESPAMRMLLKKLRCSDYLTLVAASSIIRPGVASSGMMQQYIYRYHHPDSFAYLHPKMKELLEETYGVMVYQEDVIKVAHHWAGMDLGEADILRRAMSGKYKGHNGFKMIEDKFFSLCKTQGYEEAVSREVWRQICSFGGYSFSKAHSASFAVESYHAMYMKAYYPLEFMVAVLNNFGGFYNAEVYLHEIRMQGGLLEAPCVNHSEYLTTIEGKTIYTGFIYIHNMEKNLADAIVLERKLHGAYKSLEDFINRIPVGAEQLNILIKMNAFRSTGIYKRELFWEAGQFFTSKKTSVPAANLFEVESVHHPLPALERWKYEDAFDQMELLGFPLCDPYELLEEKYKNMGIGGKDLLSFIGKTISMVGYYVAVKDTSTKNHDHMSFATFIDRDGNHFDTTHFPQSIARYPFKGRGFYHLKGKVATEFDYPSLEVTYMVKLPYINKDTQ
jgi:DNA-directed DNA polymerase III PolC